MRSEKSRHQPLLTVIVPTYNHCESIGRCLDSILEQEVDFPMEIWVLDDASTDGTADIVREYSKRDDRIVPVLREKNLGAFWNAKTAMRTVKSEYFILTEGDDYWCDSKKLQLQMDALRRHPDCTCCGHPTNICDKDGTHISFHGRMVNEECVYDIWHAPACHRTSLLFRNVLSVLQDHQWRDFEGDMLYMYLALDHGQMVYLNRVMSVYCFNGRGIWTSLSEKERSAMEQVGFYKIDRFLNFKYTKMFQPRYLPGSPKNLFTLTIPLWRGRKIVFQVRKIKK